MSNADAMTSSPEYLKTYSLNCDPFANTLDGRFFYAGTALMQRLDLITHLTQFGDSVVLVSGPRGSGKTTLLGRFAAQANQQWRLCPINADEFEQFPQLMADALVIGEVQDELKMLEHWASETDHSQLLIILVDKAELLTEPEIDLLCRLLNSPAGERTRLILFGNPETQKVLKTTLDSKDLPGSTQLLEVPRLSEEETSSYLMYRLAVAGYSGESPFTATEIRAICKAAEGWPGNVNQLAHESLLEHQARKRSKHVKTKSSRVKFGTAAWGPATLLLVALAGYFGWQRLQPEAPEPENKQVSTTQPIPLSIPEPASNAETVKPPQLPTTTATAPVDQTAAQPASQPESKTATLPLMTPIDPEPQAVTPKAELPATETAATTVAEPAPKSIAVVAGTAAPTGASSSDAIENTETITTETPVSPEPKAVTPGAELPATETVATTVAEPAPKAIAVVTGTAPAAIAPTESVTTETPPATNPQEPHREAWLLEQPGKLYSLQLLGSRDQQSILTFIQEFQLDASASAYYKGHYRGGTWYVLMYGIYPNQQAAVDASATLPAGVRKDKPWARSLSSVHKAIKEAR